MIKKITFFTALLLISVGSKAESPIVKMSTSLGDITLELNQEKAPKTVENFLKYVDDGFYSNTVFHRVINGFMIQGGGFESGMKKKTTRAPVENEANNGLKNDTGTIAMARTRDPHSATAQFFINVNNNTPLNHTGENPRGWGYAVFGKVINGMEVVNKIKNVKTGFRPPQYGDVPNEDITILSVTRVEKTSAE